MSKKADKRGLVPKLRFPEFRDAGEWKEKKIGKALIEQPRPIDMDDEGEYSLVTVKRRYGGVVSRGVFKGGSIKVKTQFLLQENDFLISKRQIVHCACGVVPKAMDGSIVSNEYSVLRVRDGFDVTFFDYFARQPKVSQSFLLCSIGIVIEKMLFKLNDWLKQEFLFPPLPEQQKIANCLASLDELLTLEAQKLDTLKTHKKGLMQQLFPAEGETLPKLRFPEFQDAGEWEEKPIGKIATLRNGFAFKSSTYIDNGRYKIITIGNVQAGALLSEDAKAISELPQDIQLHQQLQIGDILISMTGNVGRICRVDVENCLLNQRVGKLVLHGDNKEFFYQSLNNDRFREAMQSKAAGGAQGNLSSSAIDEYIIFIPQKDGEQQKIADCLASLDDLITAQTQKLVALKTHKKGLMQQLFPALDEV